VDDARIFAPSSKWELLGQDIQLTADVAVDSTGIVYCTDARHNRIVRIDLNGKITTWKDAANGSHGIAFGPDGRLYAGQHDRKRLVAFSMDGAETVIAEDAQTHHLTVSARRNVYFAEAPAHKVWLLDSSGRKRVVNDALEWPRTLRLSNDQSKLLVVDAKSNWIWRFRIQPDGSLIDGRQTYRLKDIDAGGMAFDSAGNLFVATKSGIQIYDRHARPAALLTAPGPEELSNLWFAGPSLGWLYATDGDRVSRRPVRRGGARQR
jgi:gluconolactonase